MKSINYFYAEFDGRIWNDDKVVDGIVDLHRFPIESERDLFVENSEFSKPISEDDARENHQDQFCYWENN